MSKFQGKHGNQKNSERTASLLGLYNRNKQSARTRKLSWNIEFKDFRKLVTSVCHWCNIEPFEKYNVYESKNGYKQCKYKSHPNAWVHFNGLDRIDNSKGYDLNNVFPSCKFCNFARNNRTVTEFLIWLHRIGEQY